MSEYYIGLMSGTSIDAIDAAVIKFTSSGRIALINTIEYPIDQATKAEILALCRPGKNEIERMGRLDNRLAHLFAAASLSAIKSSGVAKESIQAIGSHGQTIRHRPNVEHGFTLQIGNPALIAELTDITTVADFRRADMAAGGQGAPLVPAFHQAVFTSPEKNRAIVNIGGMANISILQDDKVSGFDTGPGNVLLNSWIQQHKNQSYDNNGDWAKANNIDGALLKQCLADDYFQLAPPKSTGREHFNTAWIKRQLTQRNQTLDPGVVQATLTELTACTISDAIKNYCTADEIYLCGGGAYNTYLRQRLELHLQIPINTTLALGIDPNYVEAAAFAWFAKSTLQGLPANIPAVTGARHPVILGAIYPRSLRST